MTAAADDDDDDDNDNDWSRESQASLCLSLPDPAGLPACLPALALIMARQASHLMFLSPRVLFHRVACNSTYSKQDPAVQSPPPSVCGRLHPRARRLPPPPLLPRARRPGGGGAVGYSLCQFEAVPNKQVLPAGA